STLKYCAADTDTNHVLAPVIVKGLTRSGIKININYVKGDYFATVGAKDTTCDLIYSSWGEELPDGDASLGDLMFGGFINATNNNNLSYLSAVDVNAKIESLRDELDRGVAAAQYGDLDKFIMQNYAPVIPLRNVRVFALVGPHVGGLFLSPFYGQFNLT